jgi:site-specific recombinase XerD
LTRFLEGLPRKLREQLARIDLLDGASVGATKPARDHLTDYEQALRDGGATGDYVQKSINRIKAILEGAKATFLTELSAAAVMRYLAGRRTDGLSVKSSNHYQACAKAFCAWLIKERRISENPLAHLAAMNAKTDRRHIRLRKRRSTALLTATRTGPTFSA